MRFNCSVHARRSRAPVSWQMTGTFWMFSIIKVHLIDQKWVGLRMNWPRSYVTLPFKRNDSLYAPPMTRTMTRMMMMMFLPCSPGQQVITAVPGRRVESAALQCVISHAARDISSLSAACQWKPNCRTILSHGPVPRPRPAWTPSIGVLRRKLPLPRSLGHWPRTGVTQGRGVG